MRARDIGASRARSPGPQTHPRGPGRHTTPRSGRRQRDSHSEKDQEQAAPCRPITPWARHRLLIGRSGWAITVRSPPGGVPTGIPCRSGTLDR